MTPTVYHIRNKIEPDDYWSNELGWTTWEQATTFHEADTKTLNLPIDGEWIPAKE